MNLEAAARLHMAIQAADAMGLVVTIGINHVSLSRGSHIVERGILTKNADLGLAIGELLDRMQAWEARGKE